MSETHWRKIINPEFLGAYSLDDGNGGYKSIVLTIASIGTEEVTGQDGTKEKMVARFKERDIKPMILNSTNCRTLEKLYKTAYIEKWIGRQFEVGVESVKVGRNYEDALRIKKYLPKTSSAAKCAECGEEVTATEKMNVAQIVAVTQKRFGKCLCAKCWVESVERTKAAVDEPEDKPAETETVNDSE